MTQKKQKTFQFILALALIIAGIIGFKAMLASKPSLEKTKQVAPLPIARTMTVNTGPMQITLTGHGTVRPVEEIKLVPQVSGKVVWISPALVNGGSFKNGDLLLSIDPADYEIAVTLKEASVKNAESIFKLTIEESEASRHEWAQINPDIEPPALVAKTPQLAAVQAKLEAEKANLKKAQLQLERTKLRAPFNGRVSNENVDMGQYVSPGQSLATLYATDAAEIVVPMEDRDLFWFNVPGFTMDDPEGSAAEVSGQVAGQKLFWKGRVVRSEGEVNERTRMVHVVVQVEKPYAKKPPLAVGVFVTVNIKGSFLEKAVIIPRSALHPDNKVWVVDEKGNLEFRDVDIARFSTRGVVIQGGLSDGEQIVVSPLKAVSDGMQVRPVLVKKEDRL
jgi:RND family efflux transporter MFP subunit